jgi:hypothetical protein
LFLIAVSLCTCRRSNEEKKEQFQIILVEHAPDTYWTGENKLDYFVTKENFTNGNALIPQYVLEQNKDNEN